MTNPGTALALATTAILACVLVAAAVAKIRNPATTTDDFASLGLPRAEVWAGVVPILELGTAGLLLINPGWGGVAAFALITAFTTNLALVIRSGRVAHCACFGGSSTKPVSVRHLARNGLLLLLALGATTLDGWTWNLL